MNSPIGRRMLSTQLKYSLCSRTEFHHFRWVARFSCRIERAVISRVPIQDAANTAFDSDRENP